jgi:hypothetical protein
MRLGHCCCTSTCRVCTDVQFSWLYATSDMCKARTPSSLAERQRCTLIFESCSVRVTAAMPTTMPILFYGFTQHPQKNSGMLRLLGHAHFLLLHLRYRPIAWVFTSGRQADPTTKFCTVVPEICGFSKWRLLHVALQVPWILRWHPGFWKICVPQDYTLDWASSRL